MMTVIQKQAPEFGLLDLAETKTHLRVTSSNEDSLIQGMIDAAQEHLEGPMGILGRTILTQQWTASFDTWPETSKPLEIPLPPLISVDEIRSIGEDGSETVWAASEYIVQSRGVNHPARLYAANAWPDVPIIGNKMEIDFTAGYGGPEKVPQTLIVAARMIVADFYDNRASYADRQSYENPVVSRLLAPFKVWYV